MATSSTAERPVTDRAGSAGALAATIMLAAQLLWRLAGSADNVVQAFPEFIVAAIARLTPLSVFGTITETYGSLAKKSLFLAVLVGVILIGMAGGRAAARLTRSTSFASRLVASGAVAVALLGVTGLVVLPIAYLGIFATRSSYTGEIVVQLVVTFAIYALAWAVFAAPAFRKGAAPMSDPNAVTRRHALARATWTGSALAAAAVTGVSAWRIVAPASEAPGGGETDAPADTTRGIIATQRARQGYEATAAPETPTPAETPQASAPRDEAALMQDATATGDPFATFEALEAEGRLTPLLTEVGDFYNVSKNLFDPTVSEQGWALTITGLVETELRIGYAALKQRSMVKKITTLMCISNELNGELTGTAEWEGVPLADLLAEAGVKPEAIEIKLHAADDYEESFPIAFGLDPDTLVVVGMNGAPLTDAHGYPARIIVPGIYGMKNVKWVDRLELIAEDFLGYWQTRGWSDPAIPQIWGRIDAPLGGDIEPGPQIAAGVATAGDRDVVRVEVSMDDGDTWADAQLEPSINPPFTWVRWAFPFEAISGAKVSMRIRATDGTGAVMLSRLSPPLPDGATGWPLRRFKVK